MVALNPEKIPGELRERPQWVCWRREERDGKPTKVPYCPLTRKRANTTDPATWATFDAALAAAEASEFDGVGFVFAHDDPYVGVDLDGVRDPKAGVLRPESRFLVKSLASYTEVSCSGCGVHVIVCGSIPGSRRRKGWLEMYENGRFFVMTGILIDDMPHTVEPRQSELDALYAEYFGSDDDTSQRSSYGTSGAPFPTDHQILEKAKAAANGRQFLVSFGNAVGRSPHYMVEADQHTMNEYAVLVGSSSKGRKGTSWGYVKRIFKKIDEYWRSRCIISGLSRPCSKRGLEGCFWMFCLLDKG